MHLLTIIFISFLIGQCTALIRRKSEIGTFIEDYERDTINEVVNSISDAQQNLANYNFYGGFYVQADDEFNKTSAGKGLDGNQEIRRILNEIQAEEINITKSIEDVEQVVRGFVSDLEYFKNKINQSVVEKIGNHVVIANSTEGEEYENITSNSGPNKEFSEEDDGYDSQPNDQKDEIQEYNGTSPGPLSGRRIYRGRNTRISQFPFMASVHVMGQFYCAGSIIASSLVITAASCLQLAWNNRYFRENPKFLYVRVGSTYYNGGGELIQVLEVYFHPSYDPKSLKNNLAILRLRRKIRLSKHLKKRVRKIRYDTHAKPLPLNTDDIIILGWGAKEIGNKIINPMNNRLSYSLLDIYGLEDCQDIYSKSFVTKKHFCAGFISKGGGACNHDVGAPGLVGGILTGVASFGAPVCGAHDAPTVFTKLGYYKDWIENIMDQPFHSLNKHAEAFVPYRMAELVATPTTRMINQSPFIDPKIKEALKGISFLPPTTKVNHDRDSAVNNMLLMSMGRPAIADQPYYQVKNDLSENQANLIEKNNNVDQEGLRLNTNIITTTGTEDLIDKHNEYFIQNNIPNAMGKMNNKDESLKPKENYTVISDNLQKQNPKDSVIDMSSIYIKNENNIDNKQNALQIEKNEQIEKNNQQYIKNSNNNFLKQSDSESESNSDQKTKKHIFSSDTANIHLKPKHLTDKRKPTLDFNSEYLKKQQILSDFEDSESVMKIKHLERLDPKTAKKIHFSINLETASGKEKRHHVDQERIQATQLPMVSQSERDKKSKHPKPLDSDSESESVQKLQPHVDEKNVEEKQHLIHSDLEIVTVPQIMSDSEQDNVKIKHPSSEYDPKRHKKNKKHSLSNNSSRGEEKPLSSHLAPVRNKEEKPSSNLDPDSVALELLDKVVDGLKPIQNDDNLKNYEDEDNEPLPENMYLPTEDTLNQVSNLPDDEVQYVNTESVPIEQGINDSNVQPDDSGLIYEEKYFNWENVKESIENKARWLQPTVNNNPYRKQRINSDVSLTPAAPKTIFLDARFREKQEAEDTLSTITTIIEANIKSYPNITSPCYSETVPVSNNSYVQYSEKPSAIFRFQKTDSDTNKERYKYNNSTTTKYSKNITSIEDREFNKMFDSTDKEDIHLSMAEISTDEDNIYSDNVHSSSDYSSSSSENGLEIEFTTREPRDIKQNLLINVNMHAKLNNTKTFRDEFYNVFADVVKEIALRSNVTKQDSPA